MQIGFRKCATLGCCNEASPSRLHCYKCSISGDALTDNHKKQLNDLIGKFYKPSPSILGEKVNITITDEPETHSMRSPENLTAVKDTSSGGDNDYWIVVIDDPKRLAPYSAECEDLIEKFKFNFAEGEAFKALWRKGQANLGNGKPGDNPLRNAEKVAYMGSRMVVIERRLLEVK